jgi:hypothetical protein
VLNRRGADERRERLLRDIPTRDGFDRDEHPPAVGRGRGPGLERGRNPRGGKADVRYVPSSENRSHGASLGNQLEPFCNGTRFRYLFRWRNRRFSSQRGDARAMSHPGGLFGEESRSYPTAHIASTRLAPMWPVIIIVVVLVPLLVLAWIRVRQRWRVREGDHMSEEARRNEWRRIWSIVIAILLVLLILFLIGGALQLMVSPGNWASAWFSWRGDFLSVQTGMRSSIRISGHRSAMTPGLSRLAMRSRTLTMDESLNAQNREPT